MPVSRRSSEEACKAGPCRGTCQEPVTSLVPRRARTGDTDRNASRRCGPFVPAARVRPIVALVPKTSLSRRPHYFSGAQRLAVSAAKNLKPANMLLMEKDFLQPECRQSRRHRMRTMASRAAVSNCLLSGRNTWRFWRDSPPAQSAADSSS